MTDTNTFSQDSVFQAIDNIRLPLVNRFYIDCNYNVKCGRHDHVFCLSQESNIFAAARLLLHFEGYFLLRNLCVAPSLRNQGVATHLVKCILSALAARNQSLNCYCFALPHLKNFYLALGFRLRTIDQVPPSIAEAHTRNCLRKRGWLLMSYCSGINNECHREN